MENGNLRRVNEASLRDLEPHGEVNDDRFPECDESKELAADYVVS